VVNVYLDTSALVKLYIEETGTARVLAAVDSAEGAQVIIADISRVESRAAIRRRERANDISGAEANRILKQIDLDVSSFFLVQPLSSALLEEALRLIDRHLLRAYDAVQLAGCLVVRDSLSEPVTFVCADTQLCQAAEREGLTIWNPLALPSAEKPA